MRVIDELEAALYLISTPIGNLGDISPRALEVMRKATTLFAEDTRHSRKLLNFFEIDRQLHACHEHNELVVAEEVCRRLAAGESCALLSDAGTPGISDPGFRLVRACRRQRLEVIPVPGPCAFIAALSASGLPTDRFLFLGFMPPKKSARLRAFAENRHSEATLVFYESTHRIDKFLSDAAEILGPERTICLARELTKHHETILTGPLAEVRDLFARGSSKGEFVVLIAKEGYTL
jgi:16S rRNA (cytidine1402-2'-O)-methyltransferase